MVTENGDELSGEDFLASLREDLATAAGPGAGAGATGSGAGEYADDPGSLVDGIDRLGSLGTDYWGYESEVPEVFVALGEVPAGVAAVPGGGGEIEVPAYLHAHDNVGKIIPDGKPYVPEGTKTEYEPGEYKPLPNDSDFPANLPNGWRQTGWYNHYEDAHAGTGLEGQALKSAGGDVVGMMTALGWNHTSTFTEFVNDLFKTMENNPEAEFWGKSSNGGGISMPIELDGKEDGITIDWTLVVGQEGNQKGNDAVLVVVLDENGKPVWKEMRQFKGESIEDMSGPTTITDLPEGKYTVAIMVIEDGNGQKPYLVLEGYNEWGYTPGDPIEPATVQDLAVTGNVIGNALAGAVDEAADAHSQQIDHHSEGKDFEVSKFVLTIGEKEYSVQLEDGEGSWSGKYGDYECSFTMDKYGEYTFTIKGASDPNMSIGDVQVKYTVTDGEGLSSEADLYIRSGDRLMDADDADNGVITGSSGNDVIFGGGEGHEILAGEGDDAIYMGNGGGLVHGGTGNDTIYCGEGSDTIAWGKDDLDGSTDVIINFELGKDLLRFDDLTGDTSEQVNALLEGASLTLAAGADDKLLLTLGEAFGNQQIEINLSSGLEESMVNALNDALPSAQETILQILLTNS